MRAASRSRKAKSDTTTTACTVQRTTASPMTALRIPTPLANLGATGLPSGVGILNAAIGLAVVLWTVHAVVVVSLFAFRLRDAARIARYYLFGRPLVTLGVLSLAVLATGVVLFTSDRVLVALGSVFTFLLWRNARPMVADVQRRFVAPPDDEGPPDDEAPPQA